MPLTITQANQLNKVADALLASDIGSASTVQAMQELEPLLDAASKVLHAGWTGERWRAAVEEWDRSAR